MNGLTDDAEADRLLAMATALIEAEVVDLDDVPDAIANEAVARIVQWSRQTRQTLGQLESEPRQTGGIAGAGERGPGHAGAVAGPGG